MKPWRLSLIFSVFCSIWLVFTDAFGWLVLNVVGSSSFFWGFLAVPFFLLSVLWSMIYLLRTYKTDRRLAITPLAVNILAFALVFWPLNPLINRIDFYVHYAARTEIVHKLESGELWNGSNMTSLVSLPSEYPRSVSAGGSTGEFSVYQDEGALQVVFNSGSVNPFNDISDFLYRSDGLPPSLPNSRMPDTNLSESLGNGWYRVTKPGLARIAWNNLSDRTPFVK